MKKSVRIIAKLDLKGPNLIKGLQFDGHRVLGRAEQFAETYYNQGIDELLYIDTVASLYKRNSLLEIITKTAEKIFIPLTVAGGIRSLDDIRQVLRAGADKVAINTYAIQRSEFLREAALEFGSQCIVLQLDYYQQDDGSRHVWTDYGREPTTRCAEGWAHEAVDLGVGEILLTSINRDGMGSGYDTNFIRKLATSLSVPVIACGGAGGTEDVVSVINQGVADAVAAASVFHYRYAYSHNNPTAPYSEAHLRMGKHIDTGNSDFLNHGYGGQRAIMVNPSTIGEVKKAVQQAGYGIRRIETTL